ncbi:hypothetical protein ISN44_As11g039150 [Arabidopsis suecica]|uniref:Uncharacterized protein n=1 Tax=Arabidopsis suecica TaxID=45249 RepID=A0A8T1ZI74_ARASU|nr:hypothetical protein ISN44_As11g039150 [Arabidopsis suecica]
MSILGFDVRFLPLVVAVSGGWYSRNQRHAVLDLIESHPSPFLPPEGFGESIKRLFSLLHTKLISDSSCHPKEAQVSNFLSLPTSSEDK